MRSVLLAAILAASFPAPERVELTGVSLPVPGFHLDFIEDDRAWLVAATSGMELQVTSLARGVGDAEAIAAWSLDLPEQPGFRLLATHERRTAGARAVVRHYGERTNEGWSTWAALVLGPSRLIQLTLVVPPAAGVGAERVLTALLDQLEFRPPREPAR